MRNRIVKNPKISVGQLVNSCSIRNSIWKVKPEIHLISERIYLILIHLIAHDLINFAPLSLDEIYLHIDQVLVPAFQCILLLELL